MKCNKCSCCCSTTRVPVFSISCIFSAFPPTSSLYRKNPAQWWQAANLDPADSAGLTRVMNHYSLDLAAVLGRNSISIDFAPDPLVYRVPVSTTREVT